MAQTEKQEEIKRLVMISNRLPVAVEQDKSGNLKITPGSGGLVTALAPVLRNRGGLWIGWSGSSDLSKAQEIDDLLKKSNEFAGFTCCPITLSKEEVDLYYLGFSNEIIWPLFHDLQSLCNFVPAYWYAYQKVNKKFAEAAVLHTTDTDFIWVHDYQLLLLGQEIRKLRPYSRLAFFLHIPFPPFEMFLTLPWRFQIIRSLLEYDLVGFQTLRDKRNFVQCAKYLLSDIGHEKSGTLSMYTVGQRKSYVGAFPIGIDYNEFADFSRSKAVADMAWHIHETFPQQTMVLSIDRLDYTKGIPLRLEAFRNLLAKYPDVHKKVALIQVIVPSRIDIPKYRELKEHIDRLVGEINSTFSIDEWVPIHYFFRPLSRIELVSYYRTSEIALVTSLKDGMNLVAKEYVASNVDRRGILILSEFTGAATQLHDYALLVNPFDIEGVADCMYRAITMSEVERKIRVRGLQRNVSHYNIYWWLETFFEAAINKKLKDFSFVQEYIPTEEKNP